MKNSIAKKRRRRIEIIEDATGKVVHAIETGYDGRQLERMRDGLYRKLDQDRFSVREVEL